jgi:hypothetical protein
MWGIMIIRRKTFRIKKLMIGFMGVPKKIDH